MDPHWFGSLDPDPHWGRKAGSGSTLKPMLINNTDFFSIFRIISHFSFFSQNFSFFVFILCFGGFLLTRPVFASFLCGSGKIMPIQIRRSRTAFLNFFFIKIVFCTCRPDPHLAHPPAARQPTRLLTVPAKRRQRPWSERSGIPLLAPLPAARPRLLSTATTATALLGLPSAECRITSVPTACFASRNYIHSNIWRSDVMVFTWEKNKIERPSQKHKCLFTKVISIYKYPIYMWRNWYKHHPRGIKVKNTRKIMDDNSFQSCIIFHDIFVCSRPPPYRTCIFFVMSTNLGFYNNVWKFCHGWIFFLCYK